LASSTKVESLLITWSGGISNRVYGIKTDTINFIEEETSEIEVTTTNCNQQPTIITVSETKNSANYYLYNLNSQSIIGNKQIADGTPLTFSTGTVNENSFYQIRVDQSYFTIALDTVIGKRVTPEIPIIAVINNDLKATPGSSYKWFLNGEQISTDQSITATESGVYMVEVTGYYGCTSISEAVDFIITGIISGELVESRVFPNPSTGIFELNDYRINGKAQFSIYDRVGRQIGPVYGELANSRLIIDISNYMRGIYILKVAYDNGETATMILSKLD
jgi:hypothetical protein